MAIYPSHFAAWSTVFISFGTTIWPQHPYRVLEHNFVRFSQSVYFARTQIACFLLWLLLQVGMCGQVLIPSYYKPKKREMRLKIELVTPLKWPSWGKQKGSLRVRHVRRLSKLYGRVSLLGLFPKLSFTSFYSGKCVYQAQSAHSILSDVFMSSLLLTLQSVLIIISFRRRKEPQFIFMILTKHHFLTIIGLFLLL